VAAKEKGKTAGKTEVKAKPPSGKVAKLAAGVQRRK